MKLSSTKTASRTCQHRLLVFLSSWLLMGSLWVGPVAAEDLRPEPGGAEEFASLDDPARAFFQSKAFHRILHRRGEAFDKSLDQVFTLRHDLPVGGGQRVRVEEVFTLRSWLRLPRRAILFMGAMPLEGEQFSVPVEGYNGTEFMAKRGFFAFTVDYVGVGDSSRPDNGFDVTFESSVEDMKTVLRYIRFFRLVRKVDLLGEGRGGVIATQLAADQRRVRSTIMNAMQYKTRSTVQLPAPSFLADGYALFPDAVYDSILALSMAEVKDFVVGQNSMMPTGPLQAAAHGLPFYDPGVANVPGLVIHGTEDFLATANDPYDLVKDYGKNGAQLAVLQGGGHYPRLDGETTAKLFWRTVIDFIDPK